jgi:hypothetical protein
MRSLLTFFLCLSSYSWAADHYVTQDGAGAMDGTSLSDAWSLDLLNNIGSWAATPTAGKISPGDTVWLNGTITEKITIQRSGTAGSPVTIRFATNAKMSQPGWSGAILDLNGRSYITVDGGANGIIESTDNGTPDTHTTSYNATGVLGMGSSNIIVRNLTVRNLYVKTSTSDQRYGGFGVRFSALSSGTYSNVLVEDCVFHDMEEGAGFGYRANPTTGIKVTRCLIYNVDDGVTVVDGNNGSSASDVEISYNRIYGFALWDDVIDNLFHHDGVHVLANGGSSTLTNVRLFGNVVGSDFGSKATSGLYVAGRVSGAYVYNNVLIGIPNKPNNGLVTVKTWSIGEVYIYNNTFVSDGGTTGYAIYLNGSNSYSPGGIVEMKNNLFVGVMAVNVSYSSVWTLTSDYNLGFELPATRNYSYSSTGSGSYKTIAQWQGLGFDANGVYNADPQVQLDYTIGAGSAARGEGENLSAIFTVDAAGAARPAAGAWDIGAFQYSDGEGGPIPTEPAKLRGRRRAGSKLLLTP